MSPDSTGRISADTVKTALRDDTALVSIMHVNNELGTLNPIREIGELCFQNSTLFHTDAAQSFGKAVIDVDDMNIDLLSLSAHKIGGIKGIGALYIRDAREIEVLPVIHGAGQELGIRGGTVATPLVTGLGEACTAFPKYYASANFEKVTAHLERELKSKSIKYTINGENKLPHIVSLTLPEVDVITFLLAHREDFSLAQGSACSSKEIEASHVLTALGLTREQAEHTFRISFTHEITPANIDFLVTAIKKAAY